jgi:hypothetical protein
MHVHDHTHLSLVLAFSPAGLAVLSLQHNPLRWLPSALRNAWSLKELQLRGCPLQLSLGDVAVLRRLPMLRTLWLDGGGQGQDLAQTLAELTRAKPCLKLQASGYLPIEM